MYIYIGKITSSHGLKGELKLKTDFIYLDKVLKKGFNFYVGENKYKVAVNSFRDHNGTILIAFDDLLDINKIEHLRNSDVYVLREDISLKNNEHVFEDYIGLDCYYNDKHIGKVTDIVDCGSKNYVLVIGEILIPLNDNFLELKNNKIILKDVEGLIDAN